jgi:hypothetical protein
MFPACRLRSGDAVSATVLGMVHSGTLHRPRNLSLGRHSHDEACFAGPLGLPPEQLVSDAELLRPSRAAPRPRQGRAKATPRHRQGPAKKWKFHFFYGISMSREMEVMWNGVKMGRFLFTPVAVFTVTRSLPGVQATQWV